ncbi:MAG: hypothetical protein HY720_07740 [Planctomycetes bacterium]|nr:hypothetical protein [Planctomycetota bacterium]
MTGARPVPLALAAALLLLGAGRSPAQDLDGEWLWEGVGVVIVTGEGEGWRLQSEGLDAVAQVDGGRLRFEGRAGPKKELRAFDLALGETGGELSGSWRTASGAEGGALFSRLERIDVARLARLYRGEFGSPTRRRVAFEIGRRDRAGATAAILAAYGVERMAVTLDETELDRQTRLGGVVPFPAAFLWAVESFLEDDRDAESPLALVLEDAFRDEGVPFALPVPAAVRRRSIELVASHANRGEIRLLALDEEPEGQESARENWIFSLDLPELSDHGHWAVVDRAGEKPVYNYGFN